MDDEAFRGMPANGPITAGMATGAISVAMCLCDTWNELVVSRRSADS
jgi:hypothetical protein